MNISKIAFYTIFQFFLIFDSNIWILYIYLRNFLLQNSHCIYFSLFIF